MAACKSLRHIFDTTKPENKSSSLIDSLSSFNHITTFKPPLDRHHSFTEIFGELHFKENHPDPTSPSPSIFPFSSPSPSPSPTTSVSHSCNNDNHHDEKNEGAITSFSTYHQRSPSFTSLNSGSLQFCTEGLGSESLDDAEDLKMEVQKKDSISMGERVHVRRHSDDSYLKKIKTDGKTMFPPPISYIGKAGKPTVSFHSYRNDGRFVLKEVRIPTQECLRARREDGWLRLSFAQPDDDDDDDDDDEVDEKDDDDDDVEDDDGGKEEREMGGFRRIEEEERGEGDKKEEEARFKDDLERGCKE